MATAEQYGRPLLFVVSGPSGAGKGTFLALVERHFPQVRRQTTFTTRAPRPGESEGVDYSFISPGEFDAKVASGAIFEYTRPYGDYHYGSSRELISVDRKEPLVVELDFRGMLRTKQLSMRRVVSVFVAPPSREVLRQRIEDRHRESNLDARLVSNLQQLETAWAYDYVLENRTRDDFSAAVRTVIGAELLRAQGTTILASLDAHVVKQG